MSGITATERAGRIRLGLALGALAGICYGSLPSLVRLAYAGGADEITVLLFRTVLAAAFSAGMSLWLKKPILPPSGMLGTALFIASIWLVGAFSYIAAIRRIPIGLAVTIFYLFPLIVALITRLWEGEKLSANRIAGLAMGFAGVTLAVGVSFGSIEPIGVGLAAIAACTVAGNVILSARVMRVATPYAAMLVMTGGSAILLSVFGLVYGLNLPTTPSSWFGLVAGSFALCLAMACFYSSITMIGSVRAAIMCNVEPIAATGLAFLILGEALTPFQLIGVALVVGAILVIQAKSLPGAGFLSKAR